MRRRLANEISSGQMSNNEHHQQEKRYQKYLLHTWPAPASSWFNKIPRCHHTKQAELELSDKLSHTESKRRMLLPTPQHFSLPKPDQRTRIQSNDTPTSWVLQPRMGPIHQNQHQQARYGTTLSCNICRRGLSPIQQCDRHDQPTRLEDSPRAKSPCKGHINVQSSEWSGLHTNNSVNINNRR